ncbi:MAG: hypothetical protein ACTS3F_07290 [Phycisphaerales bacterium]
MSAASLRRCAWIGEPLMRSAAWLSGEDRSPCWIRDLETGGAWAIAAPGNLLDPGDAIGSREGVTRIVDQAHAVAESLAVPWSGRLVLWSGSGAAMGEDSHEGFFDRSLGTWGPVALEHFKGVVDRLAAVGDHLGVRLVFRPHARHVLADPQRCLGFLRDRADAPIGLLVDPGAMLERSMLREVDDHVARAISALAPLADGVALTSVAGDPGAGVSADTLEAPPMEIVALSRGLANAERAGRLIREIERAGAEDEGFAVVAVGDAGAEFAAAGL